MNGIHDMGGMHGFGPIVREENEPVFHHDWEGRVFALRIATPVPIPGGSRNNIEQMDPAAYLTTSYYEKWYGPGGMTQQDDMENWYNLTAASKGPMARKLDLNYQMRLGEEPIHGPSTFGLPGLFTNIYSDENHRMYYQRWAECMEARNWDEMRPTRSAK